MQCVGDMFVKLLEQYGDCLGVRFCVLSARSLDAVEKLGGLLGELGGLYIWALRTTF